MNNDNANNESIINDLYQESIKGNGNEQPSSTLDQLIKNAAYDSLNQNKPKTITPKANNRSMWMAAASVAMVVPLLLWLTLNVQPTAMQQGADYFPQTEINPAPQAATKPVKKETNRKRKSDDHKADRMQVPVMADSYHEQDSEELGKITITGSSIKNNEITEGAMVEEIAEPEAMTAEDQLTPAAALSLKANKELLISEFKVKKQRINKDTIDDPMMALEWQQLNQYIAQGNKAQAHSLLTTMQQDWPDYDFSDLMAQIARL